MTLLQAIENAAMIPDLVPQCRKGCQSIAKALAELKADIESKSPFESMKCILDKTGYWAWLESEMDSDPEVAGRMDNLQELLNALKEFEDSSQEPPLLSHFLENVALQSHADTYQEGSAVTLMTVHLAKGLEFPMVFLTGLEEQLFPIGGANATPDDLEEERRLAYVGMTRARDRLIITYAAVRRLFGDPKHNLPSRFIFEARLMGPKTEDFTHPEPEPQAPSRADRMAIKLGMDVRHPEFGVGTIVEKSGHGEALKVAVEFASGKIRKFLLRYAPLEPA
jgi:DNA helicase-2/ATP-dependent DNA helicase PcrA